MNNRVLLAALAGGVAMFLLGWLWGILLMDMMNDMNPQIEGVAKDPPGLVHIFLGNVVWALLFALIFDRWANISTFKSGLIAGAWLSGLIALSFNLVFLGTTNLSSISGSLLDVVANVIVGGLGAAVVAWVLGYGNRS
jgi:hypothetical protein